MRSNDLTTDWEADQARPNPLVRLKRFLTRDVCFRTFMLFILYGMGSWVTINGIFSELPLIVYQIPEGWNAASYLVLIVSASNIGPIIYILFQKWITLRVANVTVFLLGIISMCLLIRYWDSFTTIDNAQRSTGLWALSFTSAIADATTSVVFWPFIATFHHNYIPAIMLGEGFSGLIPAALTWIQNPNNDGVPIFSTELYWGLLAILLGIALTAFIFLDRIPNDSPERNKNEPDPGTLNPKSPRTSSTAAILLSDISKGAGENYATTAWNVLPNLLLLYWLGFCQNGVKPSILSFATIPMGQIAYQYATNAGLCIDPVFALLTFFYAPSRGWIMVLSVVWTGLLIYLLIAALQSPNQDMAGTQMGERVVIVISTICSALIAFTKAATIRRLQMIHTVASASAPPTPDGNPSLLKTLFTSDPYSSRLHRICVNGLLPTFLGVFIQFGSICGALIFYYLVNHTNYFSSGY